MSKTGSANGSFFGNFIYDRVLRRRPHFLPRSVPGRGLCLCQSGPERLLRGLGPGPLQEPVLMFKLVFLQFLYDLSDRQLEERATWDLMFKCFLGLSAEELPPDHTTLCRFRQRLRAEGFQKLFFNQVVEQAGPDPGAGLRPPAHHRRHPHDRQEVDLFRLKKEHQDGDDDDHYVDRNSPDPDARFGRKTPKKGFYGYKCHVHSGIADSEFIVQATATPGNVSDGAVLPELAQPQARELTGDKAYDSKANRAACSALGVASGLYPRYPRPGRPRKSWRERPKMRESSLSAKSSTACARPVTGVCPKWPSKPLWWPWW